jgi:1-acyl-sn-glycerol-3-phosphate acyltransferase
MVERYDTEPYRFIPPFRSKFWCRVAKRVVPVQLRRKMKIMRWQFDNLDLLRESLDRKAGILLTPNHCRWADPLVVGVLGTSINQYLYYVASYHLFKQSRFLGWVMNRFGGYSIWREGSDRESLKASAHILADADRPVVLFPEGTWFRQNDRVGALQDGLVLILKQAAKQSDRPLLIHPVGLKYWMLEDPRPELDRRLEAMERRLGWHPQRSLPLPDRIEKLGTALLGLKEIEHFGSARTGNLDDRTRELALSHIAALEKTYFGKEFDGWVLERVRRIRQSLVRKLQEAKDRPEETGSLRRALADLLLCENLNAHSMEYLRECPSYERLVETVLRIEESVRDVAEIPVTPMGVTAVVGPAIDVRQALQQRSEGRGERGSTDPLVRNLRGEIQGLVDRLRVQGPPAEWNCPAPLNVADNAPDDDHRLNSGVA